MALDVLIAGRLAKPVQERTAANGNRYALAQVIVPTEGDDSVLASVICFAKDSVAALLALDKGDAVSIAGRAKVNTWTSSDGSTKVGLSVTAERVLTAYHVRRKRAASQGDADGADDQDPAPRPDRLAAGRDSRRSGKFKPEALRGFADGMAAMADDDPFGR